MHVDLIGRFSPMISPKKPDVDGDKGDAIPESESDVFPVSTPNAGVEPPRTVDNWMPEEKVNADFSR